MIQWAITKLFGTAHERELKRVRPLVEAINALEPRISLLSDAELQAKTAEFKQKIANGAPLDDLLPETFAVCREASKRVLRMRHFDVQLVGGVVLHQGKIAEMRTGEGKTLVATLPVYLNSLSGKGVHVVTVNDYLARRDAEWMGKLYGWLGLSTGVVVHSQGDEEKHRAYRSDITYGQNNEFGFDYLRDNMKFSALDYAQRELNFAIVDEVDSILIDEARTPLIISGQAEPSSHKYRSINDVIPRLKKDEHYVVDEKGHTVTLTEEGIERAQELLKLNNLYDPANLESLHILNQCLRAHSLFKRDVHYLVSDDGKVMIIDEFTGRVLPGRRWSDGLHQAVEAKEQVRILEESRTLATITFQNLFRLYKKLGGMTGTAQTDAGEFHSTYKLEVIAIPPNRAPQRIDSEDIVYKTEREKFNALLTDILEKHEAGRPVLVGTTSVDKSMAIARILQKRGVPHAVLNAKQHEKEAYIIAQAGRKGSITIATNMAGRGTDILLGGNPEMIARLALLEQSKTPDEDPAAFATLVADYELRCKAEGDEVRVAGGLHIVGTERHESRRIDNQLRGRAGRQGDPGSSQFYLSLEDDLMRIFAGDRVKNLMDRMGMPDDEPIVHPWVTKSIGDAQGKVEARNFDMRKHLLEYDEVMSQQRKTIYRIRRELLDGSYAPELFGEDGKPTGKLRKVAIHEGIRTEIARHLAAVILPHCGGKGADGSAKAPETLDEATRVVNEDGLIDDIYQTWGLRIEVKASESVQALKDRLVDDLAFSLSQQRDRLLDLVDAVVGSIVEECCKPHVQPEDWDWKGVRAGYFEHFGVKAEVDPESVSDREALVRALYKQAEAMIFARERDMGPELLLRVFRHYYLEEIDRGWVDHLSNMENLRDGIGLRGYGQKDPKQEYKKEGYELFMTLAAGISSAVLSKLFRVRIEQPRDIEAIEAEDQKRHEQRERQMQLQHGGDVVEGDAAAPQQPAQGAPRRPPEAKIIAPPKAAIQRNDACPCGSGQAFRKCHGAVLEDEGA
jgi:preprotein translocase subunit SecA